MHALPHIRQTPSPPPARTPRLDLMENTLRWRHLAPTAPDTLTCYPYSSDDPFVLAECPHVYVAGNQPEFGTRLVAGAHRLV